MKNIEKIAIDTIVDAFAIKNAELIQNVISTKAAADMAVANFKKAADILVLLRQTNTKRKIFPNVHFAKRLQ